jgi:hypothetical protein
MSMPARFRGWQHDPDFWGINTRAHADMFLVKLKRSAEAQTLWEELPERLRDRVLVWIACLHFSSEDAVPRKVVWFVDQWTDRAWHMDWPVPDTAIPYLCVAC